MTLLRQCRYLLLLVTLLSAVGFGHQVFGRFHVHHHDATAAMEHHQHDGADSNHQPDRHDQEDAEHMAEHAAFAAIVPSMFVPATTELRLLALVNVATVRVVEPRAAGIDHPPQLFS